MTDDEVLKQRRGGKAVENIQLALTKPSFRVIVHTADGDKSYAGMLPIKFVHDVWDYKATFNVSD